MRARACAGIAKHDVLLLKMVLPCSNPGSLPRCVSCRYADLLLFHHLQLLCAHHDHAATSSGGLSPERRARGDAGTHRGRHCDEIDVGNE